MRRIKMLWRENHPTATLDMKQLNDYHEEALAIGARARGTESIG